MRLSLSTTNCSSCAAPRVRVLLLSVLLVWLVAMDTTSPCPLTVVEALTTNTYLKRPSLAFSERRRQLPTSTTSLSSASISSSSQDVTSAGVSPPSPLQRRKRPSPQVTVVKTAAVAATAIPTSSAEQHAAAVAAAAAEVEWDWEPVAASVFAIGEEKPVLLFDGVCNFCNGAVNTCLDLDSSATLRFASLHSKVGKALLIRSGKSPHNHDSIVLVTRDTAYFHSDAVLRVAQSLEGLPPPIRMSANAIRWTVPTWLRDATLKFVGERRYLFGEADGPTCRLDLDGEYEGRFLD